LPELMHAHRQWMSRAPDERFTSLLDMQNFTRRLRDNSRSQVISSRGLTVRPVEDDARALQILGYGNGLRGGHRGAAAGGHRAGAAGGHRAGAAGGHRAGAAGGGSWAGVAGGIGAAAKALRKKEQRRDQAQASLTRYTRRRFFRSESISANRLPDPS
jgi:hypothetical protein